jgi:phospholipid transport system substrate-binding protein
VISRRTLFAAAAAFVTLLPVAAHADPGPVATVNEFYDSLLRAMKNGPQLGFAGRRDLLTPAVSKAFDLPAMTRITVGPQWASIPTDQQQTLIRAFSDYSVATYANRFDGYSGEKFEVDPKATPSAGGDVIVHSKLVQSNGQPVELDYLLHHVGSDGWKIIDVYLSGTISQLAAQRSEFTSVMSRGGATALIQSLRDKAAQLAS